MRIFILLIAVLILLPLATAAETKYDEQALSKIYKITRNDDGTITLAKASNNKAVEIGRLEGQVTVKDSMVLVRERGTV